MQFHRVLVFFLLDYYAANMNIPPSARKRGFKLEFPGDDSERDSLRSKFQQIKQSSNDRLTNTDVLNKVLDFWICSNLEQSHAGAPAGNVQPPRLIKSVTKKTQMLTFSYVHIPLLRIWFRQQNFIIGTVQKTCIKVKQACAVELLC